MKTAFLKYIASLLLFASNGLVASFISMSSGDIVYLRTVLGTAALALLFAATRRRLTFHRHLRDCAFIVLSGIATAAEWLLLFEAYDRVGVGVGMILNYCGPAIVVAFSPLVFKERVTAPLVAGLFAALVGMVCISGGALSRGADAVGVMCAALSAFLYAAMVIFNKMSEKVTGMENSLVQMFSILAVLIVYTAARGRLSASWAVPHGEWLPMLWLGVVNTGGACWLYFSSIGFIPAQSVSICGYLEPLSAALMAAAFLGERMGAVQIFGAVLIVLGTLWGERSIRRA